MSENLLPCPFCGEEPKKDYATLSEVWTIHCNHEDCDVGCDVSDRNEHAVIEVWNTRRGGAPQASRSYRDAVDTEMVLAHIGVSTGDAVKDIRAVIDWHVRAAFDPLVSERAKAIATLIEESVNPGDSGPYEDGEWPALDAARRAIGILPFVAPPVCSAPPSEQQAWPKEEIGLGQFADVDPAVLGPEMVLDIEEKYLLAHFDADNACDIMPGDVQGSFHRIREALAGGQQSAASTVEPVALDHLANVLYMLAELHEDDQSDAYVAALKFYNAARPDAQVAPIEGYSTRLHHTTPLNAAHTTSPEPDRLALGDIVEMHPDAPYAAEWANTTMKVVSLRVEPDGRRWISVIEGNPRHRGNGFYDSETDCIEEDHLRRVADPRNDDHAGGARS